MSKDIEEINNKIKKEDLTYTHTHTRTGCFKQQNNTTFFQGRGIFNKMDQILVHKIALTINLKELKSHKVFSLIKNGIC